MAIFATGVCFICIVRRALFCWSENAHCSYPKTIASHQNTRKYYHELWKHCFSPMMQVCQSALKEDSDDIDALLSAECDKYDDNYDDDMVSTARSEAVYRCDSPDSCSNYESLSKKSRAHLLKSSESCCNEKHHRTRKMVNTLKGIVPGANRMSAVAVLDEAVR